MGGSNIQLEQQQESLPEENKERYQQIAPSCSTLRIGCNIPKDGMKQLHART